MSDQTVAYDFPEPGLYFDAGLRTATETDCEVIDLANSYGANLSYTEDDKFLNEIADEAIDFLNTLETREGYYWSYGDNADGFGLWTTEGDE